MENETFLLQRVYDQLLSNMRPAARKYSATWLKPTSECIGPVIKKDISSKTLRPGIAFQLITTFVFGGATVLIIREAIVHPADKLGLLIFLIILFGGFLVFALYQFLFNKKINYKITIDHSGMKVGNDSYSWSSISATGILVKGFGRNKINFLVVVMENRSDFKIYPLRLFVSMAIGGFPRKLSSYIEHFKPTPQKMI
jgi:hypothetical protein